MRSHNSGNIHGENLHIAWFKIFSNIIASLEAIAEKKRKGGRCWQKKWTKLKKITLLIRIWIYRFLKNLESPVFTSFTDRARGCPCSHLRSSVPKENFSSGSRRSLKPSLILRFVIILFPFNFPSQHRLQTSAEIWGPFTWTFNDGGYHRCYLQ